jgi:pimeloyl-ACP methyl ester carboxylesterase
MFKKSLAVFSIVVLFLIAYTLFLRPNLILSTPEAKERVITSEHSKFMQWKGNDVHYKDEGEGPFILMIHGFAGSHYNFQAITEMMKDRYRIIRPDVPGMGLSDFNHYTSETDFFEEYQDFFRTFIDHLGVDSMYVMGNSLGGALSLLVADLTPEKVSGLILLNSAGYDLKSVLVEGAGPLRWNWFRPVAAKGMPMPVVKYGVIYPFADRSKVDPTEFPFDYAMLNREGVLDHLFNLATSGQEPDTTMFTGIKVPTLIIWGEEDVIIPVNHADRFQRDIAGSEKKIYSPCGHMPMMEIPDSIVVAFEQFRNKVNSASKPLAARPAESPE